MRIMLPKSRNIPIMLGQSGGKIMSTIAICHKEKSIPTGWMCRCF